ncbi:MAG TPA: hypothetical protein VNE39_18425 [Planctomycetota bacterium]|nr:hypothetical protein [Planctomycetota bacterium]
MRTLFVGKNNELKDKLEVSADGGTTYTGVDLTAATGLKLEIFDVPTTILIEKDGLAHFTVDALGNAKWQPGAADVTTDHLGIHKYRWTVKTALEPQGVVFDVESDGRLLQVEIKR